MTIIAVKGIPTRWTLKNVEKSLAKVIRVKFEALNFEPMNNFTKTCYLKLYYTLNPQSILKRLNKSRINRNLTLKAFITDHEPKEKLTLRPLKLSHKMCVRHIPIEKKPEDILVVTHREIMTELQCKYTDLYNLSRKTGHKLLDSVAQTIFERLKTIMDANPKSLDSCFALSKSYRKMHPHFGDFQMLLSSLHRLQDAAGVARSQLNEHELITVSPHPYAVCNVPIDKVKEACTKYSNKIIKTVSEHIKNLKTDGDPAAETEEEKARKRVREELKKISPFLNMMIKQVISTHLVPEKTPFHKVRIYGEPFMPSKMHMEKFLRLHHSLNVMRSVRIFNLLTFDIPPTQFSSLIALDGTVAGRAKLVIRSYDIPLYNIQDSLITEMKALFGAVHVTGKFKEDLYLQDNGDEMKEDCEGEEEKEGDTEGEEEREEEEGDDMNWQEEW